MSKRFISFALVLTMALSVTGCGSSSEIAKLNNMQALNSESTVSSYSLSTSEKEEAVYAQVVERQLLDLTTLDSCTDNEIQQVLQFMNNVDAQLVGQLSVNDGVISEEYTNYLLMEFEKTPYYWQRAQTTIRGIDAESRSIVVDVTYKTINFKKDVQAASYITQGEPNYDKLMQVRFDRYIAILAKQVSHTVGLTSWEDDLNEFRQYYGEPADIIKSQRSLSLTENIYETGNQKTYTGLVDSSEEDSFGTMTIRYVLTSNYNLGVNTGLTCSHMYKTSYVLDNDCTETMELFKDDGYATIADNIYSLIYSYFTCIDESDYNGLYSLTKDFSGLDKYYNDYFDTTYRKHNGFTVSLFNVEGTKIKCGVSISSKVRAKGSNMTFPIYTDRYYVELELIEDKLKVTNMVLLSSTLEGEPAISTSDADVSGFVSSIDLDNQDKKDIETLISEFGAVQLLNDTSSDSFGDVVDTSMSQSQLSDLKNNMLSKTGDKKVTWLVNYMQGTPNYASVKCRELFKQSDNSIIEADVTYSFINKGGYWYICGYDINSSVILDTTNLTTTGSLCVCTAGKVVALTSQVVNTSGGQGGNSLENVGTTYDHDVYTPVLKSGSTEQGLVLLTPDTITEEQQIELINKIMSSYGGANTFNMYDEFITISNQFESLDVIGHMKSVLCIYYNYVNNRYSSASSLVSSRDGIIASLSSLDLSISDLKNDFGSSSAEYEDLEKLHNTVTAWITMVSEMSAN